MASGKDDLNGAARCKVAGEQTEPGRLEAGAPADRTPTTPPGNPGSDFRTEAGSPDLESTQGEIAPA